MTRGNGAIINIGSIVGIAPDILDGLYGGNKAFVLALSHSLQDELADKGVHSSCATRRHGAIPFWDVASVFSTNLQAEIVMTTDDLVDAGLAGFDQGELVTTPPLPDKTEWFDWEAARRAMAPRLSLKNAAVRYTVTH